VVESMDVDTGALAEHARTLGFLEGEVRTAFDAARRVTLTGDAYGELCREFPALLDRLARVGQGALQAGVEALDSAAAEMRATTTTYEAQEAENAARFA
jgi:Excreted virulence factor EspC, type VII ESX diderm